MIEDTVPPDDGDGNSKRDIFSVVVHKHQFSVPPASPRSLSPLHFSNGDDDKVDEFVEYSPALVSRRRITSSPYHRRNKMSSLSNTTLSQRDPDAIKEGLLNSLSHLDLLDESEHVRSSRNLSPSTRMKQRLYASLGQLELDSDEERLRRKRQLLRQRRRPSNPSKMYFDDPSVQQASISRRSLSPSRRSASARALSTADYDKSRSRHTSSGRNLSPSRQIDRKRVNVPMPEQEGTIDTTKRVDRSSLGKVKSPKAQRHRLRASAYASMQNGLNNSDSKLGVVSSRSSRTLSPSGRHRRRASANMNTIDGLDKANNMNSSRRRLSSSSRSLSPKKWMNPRRYNSVIEPGTRSSLNNSDSNFSSKRSGKAARPRRASIATSSVSPDDGFYNSKSTLNSSTSRTSLTTATTKGSGHEGANAVAKKEEDLDQSITWMFNSSITSWDLNNVKQDEIIDSKTTLQSIHTQSSLALALSKNGRRFPNNQDASVQSDQSSTWNNQSLHSALDFASVNHSTRTRSTHSRRKSRRKSLQDSTAKSADSRRPPRRNSLSHPTMKTADSHRPPRRQSLPDSTTLSPELQGDVHPPSSANDSKGSIRRQSRQSDVGHSSKGRGRRGSRSRSSSRHKRHRRNRGSSAPQTPAQKASSDQPTAKSLSMVEVRPTSPLPPDKEQLTQEIRQAEEEEGQQSNGFGSVRRLSSTLQRWLDGKRFSASPRRVQHVVGSAQLATSGEHAAMNSPNSPAGNKSVKTALTQSTMSTSTPDSTDGIDGAEVAEDENDQ